jgi:hypothetical protein
MTKHRTVFRGYFIPDKRFVNLAVDGLHDVINWDGTKESMIERLDEMYGTNWAVPIEIQRWQLTEERIDHITGDGIDYQKSF